MNQVIGPKSLLYMTQNYIYFQINMQYEFRYQIDMDSLF